MSRIGQWPEIVMHDWKNPHLVTLVLLLAQASASRARFAGRNCKNPPKIEFKIREIDESYFCLQRFDKFWMWSAGNRKRKLFEFAESSIEKLVELPWTNLYFGGFLTFGTTVRCCIVLYVGDVPSFESVRKPKVSQSNTAKIYFINTSRLWPVISPYSLKYRLIIMRLY